MTERPKKILIVGGSTGGIAVARRLRLLSDDVDITLVDRSATIGQATFDPCFRVDCLSRHEAIRIDRNAKHLIVRDLETDQKRFLPYDRLILSPGATSVRPQVEGILSPLVRTVRTAADADSILRLLEMSSPRKLPVAVLGGSGIGLALIEAFRKRDMPVVLIEAAKQVVIGGDTEMIAPLHRELRLRNVDIRFGVSLSRLIEDSNDSIRLEPHDDEAFKARLVVVAAGVRPEVSLALDAGLSIGITGGIRVNDRMQTLDPDIYAIGDAVEVSVRRAEKTIPIRLASAGPVSRQAVIAADHLHGFRHHSYESFGGVFVCRFFDMVFAMTGSSEKQLKRERIAFEKVYIHQGDREKPDVFQPGSTLKILFSPLNGLLLGAQCVGRGDEIVQRINLLATTLRFGGTVRQLCDLEFGFPSPFSFPQSPIHVAADVATDLLDGLIRNAGSKEIKRPGPSQLFLDIRPLEDHRRGALSGAVSMPLTELPKQLDQLNREREYIVYGQDGLDGYHACRLLQQHGIQAKNLPGGWLICRDLFEQVIARSPDTDS